MKYLKYFENNTNIDLNKKYLIFKPKSNTNHYILEIKEIRGDKLYTKKLYTLREDGIIKKNKHRYFSASISTYVTIYQSNNLKSTLEVLKTINDANKYNL